MDSESSAAILSPIHEFSIIPPREGGVRIARPPSRADPGFTRVPTPLHSLSSEWKTLAINECVGLDAANEVLHTLLEKQEFRMQEEAFHFEDWGEMQQETNRSLDSERMEAERMDEQPSTETLKKKLSFSPTARTVHKSDWEKTQDEACMRHAERRTTRAVARMEAEKRKRAEEIAYVKTRHRAVRENESQRKELQKSTSEARHKRGIAKWEQKGDDLRKQLASRAADRRPPSGPFPSFKASKGSEASKDSAPDPLKHHPARFNNWREGGKEIRKKAELARKADQQLTDWQLPESLSKLNIRATPAELSPYVNFHSPHYRSSLRGSSTLQSPPLRCSTAPTSTSYPIDNLLDPLADSARWLASSGFQSVDYSFNSLNYSRTNLGTPMSPAGKSWDRPRGKRPNTIWSNENARPLSFPAMDTGHKKVWGRNYFRTTGWKEQDFDYRVKT